MDWHKGLVDFAGAHVDRMGFGGRLFGARDLRRLDCCVAVCRCTASDFHDPWAISHLGPELVRRSVHLMRVAVLLHLRRCLVGIAMCSGVSFAEMYDECIGLVMGNRILESCPVRATLHETQRGVEFGCVAIDSVPRRNVVVRDAVDQFV
jgi:hypothetical protein